jgi:hypothetical protein
MHASSRPGMVVQSTGAGLPSAQLTLPGLSFPGSLASLKCFPREMASHDSLESNESPYLQSQLHHKAKQQVLSISNWPGSAISPCVQPLSSLCIL